MHDVRTFFNSLYVKGILFLIFLYLLIPDVLSSNNHLCIYYYDWSCVDESWMLSINWALQKHLMFGKDYLFTYGPLGFLSTRVAMGFNPLYFLLFDLFILGNAAFIFVYIFRKYYTIAAILVTLLTVITIADDRLYLDQIVFIILLISIFWINYALKHSQISGFIIPIVATVLVFFIKANASFIGLLIFYGYFGYFCFLSKDRLITKFLFGAAAPCLIFLLSYPLNVDIPGYIRGSLNLIDGYNDAVNATVDEYNYYIYCAIILIVVFLLTFFTKNPKKNLLLGATFGMISYVLFKQSFVRPDPVHVEAFFAVFPAMCAILAVFYRKTSKTQIAILVLTICFCYSTGLSLKNYQNSLLHINYFTEIISPHDDRELLEFKAKQLRLPDQMKEIIGQSSVDIIPWNINYLYLNQLNYVPRPVVQSYAVYTPYLINLNKQKYADQTAPEFVIYSGLSVDNRYPFFDDQEVKLELIKDYEPKEYFQTQNSNFVLFKRRPDNARIEISAPVEETISFNQDYNLKDINKIYFVKFNIQYSLLGKAVRFSFKPFIISIIFTLEDGSTKQHRAILPILNNGVVINPYIENELDFLNLAKDGLAKDAKKIKSFKMELDSSIEVKKMAAQTYNQEIKMMVSELKIVKNGE